MKEQEYTVYVTVTHSIVVTAETEDKAIEKAKNVPLIDWEDGELIDFDAYVGNEQ